MAAEGIAKFTSVERDKYDESGERAMEGEANVYIEKLRRWKKKVGDCLTKFKAVV